MRILVTGGAGFLGSALIRHLLADTGHGVINVDALTYAALPGALALEIEPRYVFEQADVREAGAVEAIFARHDPDGVIHLAADSRVDVDRGPGGIRIHERGRHPGDAGSGAAASGSAGGGARRPFRWLQVSTDEIYGSAAPGEIFDESSDYAPNSPYAASKAAGDQLVHAWRVPTACRG